MRKTRKSRPLIPVLIPSQTGEPLEEHLVHELTLEEARDMLQGEAVPDFSASEIIRKVRLAVWRGRPALYVEDLALAPYIRYFVRIKGETGLEKCPKCGDWFVQKQPNSIYCSVAHREAHRVIRWRAGKSEAKKKWLVDTHVAMSRV